MINKILIYLCKKRNIRYVNWDTVLRHLIAHKSIKEDEFTEMKVPAFILDEIGLSGKTSVHLYGYKVNEIEL